MADKKGTNEEKKEIRLSTPWFGRASRGDIGAQRFKYFFSNSMPVIRGEGNIISGDYAQKTEETFIRERSQVHQEFIREQAKTHREIERTKRTGLWLAAILIAIACILPVFAPEGRETISYLVSASLVIFAAGAVGYTAVTVRSKQATLAAKTEKSN